MLQAVDPVERVLWALLLALVGAFMLGTWLNRQRSKAIGGWLQGAMGVLGGQTTWKWIRSMSSGAQVTVTGARTPFRWLEIGYYLLTREFAPLWALEQLRGKHDLLSVRANLRGNSSAEFEVVPLQGKLRHALDEAAGDQPWRWIEMPAGLGLASRGDRADQLSRQARPFLERYGRYVQRLSLRERQPNLVAFLSLTGLEETAADDLFRALGKLATIDRKE